MDNKYNIDQLLEEVVTLPSLPGTVAHIMRLVTDPQCSLATVAKSISADPPLAIKTLRLVNTAYYGLRQKISTIEHAVVLLGTKVIKNLAFTATVFDIMKGSIEPFFRHSVTCAVTSRLLVETYGGAVSNETAEEAFVYGLLHDIGKVILQQFLPEESEEVARMSLRQGIPWCVAEQAILGVDHAQLGARLAINWKLPDLLVDGIAGHHDVARCTNPDFRSVAARVAVADYICNRCGISGHKGAVVDVSEEAWQLSGIASGDVPLIMDTFLERLPYVEEMMQIAS